MNTLGRIAVFGALIEVWAWTLATALRPGSWRYNISDLYASGAPQPALVMAGEATFAIAVAALAAGIRRALPSGDHRSVGCGLLALASIGTIAGALTRNSCEESVPRCKGQSFVTVGDWVHGIGGLAEILGIVGAALVLAVILNRTWAWYSVVTGCAVFVGLLTWGAVPYPWVGTAERVLAIVLVGWVGAVGSQLTTDQRAAGLVRTGARQPRAPARSAPCRPSNQQCDRQSFCQPHP